jgi:hypothetical protein
MPVKKLSNVALTLKVRMACEKLQADKRARAGIELAIV